jgi:uncharacterized integral membrane protein
MGAFLRWLILLPVFLIVIAFAIANRRAVIVNFDPFDLDTPAVALEMPLFLVVFIAMLAGLLIGGLADWIAQGRHRRTARREKRHARKLEREVEKRREEDIRAKADAGGATPATPARADRKALPAR